jgi:hypothetical protein
MSAPAGSFNRVAGFMPGKLGASRGPGPDVASVHLNGRNLRFQDDSRTWEVDIPYLTADAVNLSPRVPLNLLRPRTYRLSVSAGEFDVTDKDLNRAIAHYLSKPPLTNAQLSFRDGNQVGLTGRLKLLGLPLPFSLSAKVSLDAPTSLTVQPQAVSVLGIPVLWLMKLLHLDLGKLAGVGPMVKTGPGESLQVDLSQQSLIQTQIKQLSIQAGKAKVVLGNQPDREVPGRLRLDKPDYFELTSHGDVALHGGTLRDADLVAIPDDTGKPYDVNHWDTDGYARLQSGDLVLSEAVLKSKFGQAGGDDFSMTSISLQGTDLHISGYKNVLDAPIPVSFQIRFTHNAPGELLLQAHDVKVAGFIPFSSGQIEDALAQQPGMRKTSQGVVLDLKKTASLEMPPIRNVVGEPGSLVIEP